MLKVKILWSQMILVYGSQQTKIGKFYTDEP
jgi:hypothetical protein